MKVVICDLEGGGRERQLVKAFDKAGATVFLVDSKGRHDASNLERSTKLPEVADLLVLHKNDEATWVSQHRGSSIQVYFSGGGAPKAHSANEIWIERPVHSPMDVLSSEEARQVLDWAHRILSGESNVELPWVLRPTKNLQVLSALAVLCQGYLAVHWDIEKRQPDLGTENGDAHRVVLQAQKEMGWHLVDSETLDSQLRDAHACRELQTEVRAAGWWMAPFAGVDLASEVNEELNSSEGLEAVRALVKVLLKQQEVRPKVVAECLLALQQVLGRK